MKLLIIILLIYVIMYGTTRCYVFRENKRAQIKFEITEYDFGELKLDSEANYSFKYSNSGDVPLIIQNVKTSCGCILPVQGTN